MMRRHEVVTAIRHSGVVAIVRMEDASRVVRTAEALVHGGVTVLEVTMTVPGAVELIGELAQRLAGRVVLGAGTVLDVETAERVIAAGATFVVSPVFVPEVIRVCHEHDAAALPGCFSPTEIYSAHRAGADIIKVFPATALGPQYFRDVRAPLPGIPIMPTGGVTAANVHEWIAAGAFAVGVGSALIDPEAVRTGRFEVLSTRAASLVAAVAGARAALAKS